MHCLKGKIRSFQNIQNKIIAHLVTISSRSGHLNGCWSVRPVSSTSAPRREGKCKNKKIVIHVHCQRLVWAMHQLLLLLLPTGKVYISSSPSAGLWAASQLSIEAELFPSLGWGQSLVASQCHLLRHAWLFHIECAHWKFHISQLDYRRGF